MLDREAPEIPYIYRLWSCLLQARMTEQMFAATRCRPFQKVTAHYQAPMHVSMRSLKDFVEIRCFCYISQRDGYARHGSTAPIVLARHLDVRTVRRAR